MTKNSSISKLYKMMRQYDLESVAPKLEQFRDSPYRFNGAYGGRGAGAKSWSFDSLIVQRAHREKLRIACFREIQASLKESSYENIRQTVNRLGYTGWKFLKDSIRSPAGSYFIFRGLKDVRAAGQIKSYEGFDIFRIEEASAISAESWSMIMPTLRKKGSKFYITWNPESEMDPVMELFVNHPRDDCKVVFCEPEGIDNPWWNLTELPGDSAALKKSNPDEWLHIFGGHPRAQGINAIMSRVLVNQAMVREIINPVGNRAVGCDVSDYGDDYTVMYMRQGLKVIKKNKFLIPSGHPCPGELIAQKLYDMVNGDPSVPINLDVTGIGTSARDFCYKKGLNINPIHFAENAVDKNQYANLPTEMWFQFKNKFLDICDIMQDNDLLRELSGRLYSYDKENRFIIEPKKDFKERIGHSPDDSDALLLCFYNKNMQFDPKTINEMAERRKGRGRNSNGFY